MALASKESAQIHDKSGDDLSAMQARYNNSKHVDLSVFEGEAALYTKCN